MRLAGAYRPLLKKVPVPTGPKVAGISSAAKPTLQQLLAPTERAQRIRSELNTLPSPKAIGLLTSRGPRGQKQLSNPPSLSNVRQPLT